MTSTDARRWIVIGAPLDSSGEDRGEANAPAALRAAGLVERTGATDEGDISTRVDSAARDQVSGVIGFDSVRGASVELRGRIGAVLAEGVRPLVLGGDCTLLVGVIAALRDRWERPGLWFVDGHLDFYDGTSSPTGEAADMDLAILTGHGPAGLIDLAGPAPMVHPGDVIVLGHRSAADTDSPEELDAVDPEIELTDAPTVSARGPGRVGREAAARLNAESDIVWLHIDLDVLSVDALPAVSYHQSGGLTWEELSGLLEPLARSERLAGISIADLNADLDDDGRFAERVVDLLADLTRKE